MLKKLTRDNISPGRGYVVKFKASVAKKHHLSGEQSDYLKFFKDRYKSIFYRPNYEISPILETKTFDNRPYVTVKIFDTEITALFDSGATTSIIGADGQDFLDFFEIKVNPAMVKNIAVADGSPQTVTGVVDLPVMIKEQCRVVKALVVPSVRHGFIFGSDFARQFSILVDFKNNTWFTQDDTSTALRNNNKKILNSLVTLEELNSSQRIEAQKIIDSFKDISSDTRIGLTNKISMTIDTGDAPPFKKKQYLMSPYMLKILNEELDEMLRLGVVEPSNSPYCSPVLLVKKPDGSHRFCLDSRSINAQTRYDSYPLPNIDRILNMLRDAKFISTIDLRKAFWQIPLDEKSREKTAFSITGRGLFHFKVVPFGLCNAAQVQQRLVDKIFGPRFEPKIFTYLDDIIILGSTYEEHVSLLKEVKNRLEDANLTISIEKCEFFKTTLKFLGYIVGANGLRMDPEKISSMINYPRPTNTTEIKRFIGLCSWYRRFIKNFSTLTAPINDLLRGRKKKESIKWTSKAEDAFSEIKQALVSAPVLCQPDFSIPFTVASDASDFGLGGVLTQIIDGEERVIAYASRSLSRTERNYSVTEKECLALLFNLERFRPWIEGVRFTVITDHYSLLYLNNLKNPTGKLARWAMKLRQYSFDLKHRKGSLNVVPDALSRTPEVTLIDISTEKLDTWYLSLKEKIVNNPDDYAHFKVENDIIYKLGLSRSKVKTNINEWKILVPKYLRNNIISSCHDPPVAGHFGLFKTLGRIQENYYWPRMKQEVLRYVKACKTCSSQKLANNPRMGFMGAEKSVQFPWQIIAVDLMGPFPRSPRGFAYLLVIGDWFTKYTLVHPIRKATAKSITKFIEEEVFLERGVPQFILCDNGSQFAGTAFKNLARQYGVQKIWFSPRYSPQCNFVERNNKTIGTTIRCYIDDHINWDKELPKIRHAINTAKHEVTGYSPAFLNYGRYIPISGRYYGDIKSTEGIEISAGDRDSYINDVKGLTDIFAEVRKRLHAAYQRNANSYNLRKRDAVFEEGDRVWRRNKVLSNAAEKFSAKLAAKYILSFVEKRISRLVYSLRNIDGTYAGEWHIKDLKKYFGSNSDISVG